MALRSPTPFHSFWGVFPTSADLPNVAASPTQNPALEAGDTAWVTATGQLYACVTPTLGAAVWVVVGPTAVSGPVGGTFTFVLPTVVGDAVYKTGVAGEVAPADNASVATAPSIGIVTSVPAAGVAVVAFVGEVPVAGLVPGVIYWLGSAGGLVTPGPIATPGTVVQIMGTAKDPGTLILAPKVHTVL
ncbi:MAG TPA: hypothetical protein VIY27_06055 [Myxococcota bacterium]